MPPKRRAQLPKSTSSNRSNAKTSVPDVYREMLAEALPSQSEIPERPLKRRRTGRRDRNPTSKLPTPSHLIDSDDEADLVFEDVLEKQQIRVTDDGEQKSPPKSQQTAYRDSDNSSEESEYAWEGIDLEGTREAEEPSGDLELTLIKRAIPQPKNVNKRKIVTKEERGERLQIHKMHVLCLLSYLHRRNTWCNDTEVHRLLKPLLDKKTVNFLNPRSDLSQFSQTESLKRGIEQASTIWRTKFKITERGQRRALWAENKEQLQDFQPLDDGDSCLQRADFRAAAKKLTGSRDVGAQLYCALLRSAGVETRLICSLQPLSFNAGGPTMPQVSQKARKPVALDLDDDTDKVDIHSHHSSLENNSGPSGRLHLTPRHRLGHPNAADYHIPDISAPTRPISKPKLKVIRESPYPVFWVEVFDEAHQKWIPVDPLVTETVAKPRAFEPPISDKENSMSYVIAFEQDGCARDVTRRYTKAFNAKTRKYRVESTTGGEKWWRRAMRLYYREWKSDADQIEDTELATLEGREPMPKNVQDFKDHPIYALERHLKRNEVLVSTHSIGRVATGRDSGTLNGKKMENVYRRKDVKVAKSADAWYRLGRDVKMGEQPIKTVEVRRKIDERELGDGAEERASTNLYTEEQTELYEPPPVVDGKIPKNSYGNLDIYVPTMVPKGGIHIKDVEASQAARIINVDYADALVGFEFRGRHGTAILKGIVVATEYHEAVEAVIQGLRDEQTQIEENMRTLAALKMWKKFMIGLRIKERIDGYQIEGEESKSYQQDESDEMASEEYDDDATGGGFFPE